MNQSLLFVLLVTSLIVALFVFNFALVKYYTDPLESIKPVLILQAFALTMICLHALMIPLDSENALYKNSGTVNNSIVQLFLSNHNLQIQDLYTILHLTMIGLCLFCLPFSFFYAKNIQDSEEQDLFRGENANELASDLHETPGKFAMKGFDSSSDEEEEEDNMGLLELDSDDEDVEQLQTPKLGTPGKKKNVSEKRVILMTALLAICGK